MSTRVGVDEFGSFHGGCPVPGDLGTGVLRVNAEVDDHSHQGEARVQDYVKPTFYLELNPEKENIVPGQPLKATVRARRYAGGVPEGARYEVVLYRSLLDAPAWVDDRARAARAAR